MKKILVLSLGLAMLLSLGAEAQTFAKKGIIETGGVVSFSSNTAVANGNSASNSTSTFTISPNAGYFIMDGLQLGAVIAFTSVSYSGNSTTMFAGYPQVQYYFDTQSKVYPFLGAFIGYNTISNGGSASGIIWGGHGGVAIQVANNVLIKFAAYYDQSTLNPSGSTGGRNGYNEFGIQGGFSVFFDTN